MKIVNVVCAKGRTGFFFDDQRAIKKGAVSDGAAYLGETVTPGFKTVRQAGEAISVMIVLEDGQVAYGDCAAVQYSGAGGRDPLFLAKDFIPVIEEHVAPTLAGKEITSFREMCAEMEAIEVEGMEINPGDFLMADESGIVVIPKELFAKTMVATLAVKIKESKIIKDIADGITLAEIVGLAKK